MFLILSTLQSFSSVNYSQLTLLTLEKENSTVREVISQIEKESEFYFTYNLAQIDLDKKVSIRMENKEISEILDTLFPEGSVKYTIRDRHVVLFREDQLPAKNNSNKPDKPGIPAVNQQGRTISGTVTDGSLREPLIGVNVFVKGTTNGAVTDMDGKFSLQQVPEGAVLVVSYVGYVTQEIRVGNQASYAIVLQEDTQSLDEVVVVGYGTQKKGEVTSSVVKITEKDFNKGPSGNPMQLVEGRVAGLVINRPGGSDPNGDITIQMRGVGSLKGNNQPLIIIDGIPGNMTTLNAIAAEDIESMDVLRDGSAAAIYGTRGNNGVVIVTTKQAKPRERIQLDYSGYMAHDFIAKIPELLSAEEYVKYAEDTKNPVIKDFGGRDDVYDALLNKGNFSHNHNISAAGGTANGNYTASIGYRKSEGLAITTNREQVTARLSVNQKVLNDKVQLNINLASSSNTGSSFGNLANDEISYNPFYMAMRRNPTYPIYNKDGSYYEDYATYGEENPIASLRQRNRWYERKNLLGSVKATWTIIEGLNASAFTALEKNDNYSTDYRSKYSYDAVVNSNGGTAAKRFQRLFNKTFESTLDYKKTFNRQHNLNAMVGYSYQDLTNEWFSETNKGFLTDAFETNHIGSGSWLKEGKAEMDSNKDKNTLIAFFGRANYNFEGKYMLSASVRREGSSKFGDNHKWGWFPAVSAGWAISEESFMSDIDNIDMIKLRVGYGVTGSLPNDSYMSLTKIGSTFGTTVRGYYFDGRWYSNAFGPTNNPNPDLRWEKNQSLNVGVDFGFFNNRISGNIDVYQKKTTDLINGYQAQVPAMIHPTIQANVGTIMNRGVELAVNAAIVDTRDFKYDANLTFSYETNKLESMSNDLFKGTYEDRYGFPSPGNIGYAQRLEEGQPIGSFYGYVYEGITDDGKWILKDLDGKEGYSNNDKRYIGNGIPKIKAGLMNNFTYKNWDFSFFLRGMFMYDILNTGRIYFGTTTNIDKSAYNVYKDALNVKLTEDPRFSDYFLEKGDFLKLDNVTLGYTFQFPESKYLKSLRIYGYCSNLAVITGYSGIDPEVRITGLEPGIDKRDSYPRTRTFSFGVNVSF
ncbi:MAG: TonB-dependent receptor [Tannerellaceae bacterium]|nr:TonB-dependent receptor [Tannerellaceae bacterium]